MLYFLECPYHTQSVKNALINWTATYRRDSDLVAPYERWQYYDPSVTQIPQTFNYAANKTKKVKGLDQRIEIILCKPGPLLETFSRRLCIRTRISCRVNACRSMTKHLYLSLRQYNHICLSFTYLLSWLYIFSERKIPETCFHLSRYSDLDTSTILPIVGNFK